MGKRQYQGERDTRELLAWLNGEQGPARTAIVKLLQNLGAVRLALGGGTSEGDGLWWPMNDVRDMSDSQTKVAIAAVRREMGKHRFWFELEQGSNSDRKRQQKMDFRLTTSKSDPAGEALLWISKLAFRGFLSKVRHCTCGKWFFARLHDQQWCSESCRKRQYKSSPEFKEKRRNYMRKYRAQTY